MSRYLFLFTLGPVQSFIAQARKTQDLYAGSKLLSDLIEKAKVKLNEFKNLKKIQNVNFIFPDESIKHKPNRFLAEIETSDVKGIGKELKDFVEEEFKKIAENALSTLSVNPQMEKSFKEQIKNFLQIYWVALPLTDNYSEEYSKVERYLGAVKNVRFFHQLGETGRKCSLCGERNVLVYRKTSSGKIPEYTPEYAIELKNEYKLNPGEGLCAVCFTKRFYKADGFPSTAEIAAMDWLQKTSSENKTAYKKLFKNFDEQLYYEENLRKEYLKKYDHRFKDGKSLDDAKKHLKRLYDEIGRPPKYYALIMLDGDNMGRWLSGEFLEDKTQLKEFHKRLSKELGIYAEYVDGKKNEKGLIKSPKGQVVYAGGDDVLAFINLKHLLPVMNDLRKKFPKFEDLGFKLKDNPKSSASAGIVIAHYKTPLSEVLKWARKMEKEAKEEGGRDAFAIAVLKHSGEINKTVWKWGLNENGESRRTELLEELVKELQDDKRGFSNTFIKNLNIEFMKLDEIEDKWVKTELKRLLDRACQIKGDKETKDKKVKKWQNELFDLYIDSPTKDNFLSFLNIADFLARRIK